MTKRDLDCIKTQIPSLVERMIAQGELLEADFQAIPCAKDGIDKDNLTLSRRRFCIITNPALVAREREKEVRKANIDKTRNRKRNSVTTDCSNTKKSRKNVAEV